MTEPSTPPEPPPEDEDVPLTRWRVRCGALDGVPRGAIIDLPEPLGQAHARRGRLERVDPAHDEE